MIIYKGIDVRQLQRSLNRFRNEKLKHVGPIKVDGVAGQGTSKAVREAAYFLGYGKLPQRFVISSTFVRRLRHPRSPKYSPVRMLARAFARRRKQRKNAKPPNGPGFGTFDGRTVPKWMVPWLEKSRRAGWTGTVVSGVRTPAYSVQLCYGICGAPRCPGLCAGTASNHNMESYQGYPFGAIDVSDYIRFGVIQRQIGSPLKNDLPRDRVHFSVSGH